MKGIQEINDGNKINLDYILKPIKIYVKRKATE